MRSIEGGSDLKSCHRSPPHRKDARGETGLRRGAWRSGCGRIWGNAQLRPLRGTGPMTDAEKIVELKRHLRRLTIAFWIAMTFAWFLLGLAVWRHWIAGNLVVIPLSLLGIAHSTWGTLSRRAPNF